VDCGLLAVGQHSYETFGGKPRSVPALERDRQWASSSLAAYIIVRKGLAARASSTVDSSLGNSVGANGWSQASLPFARVGGVTLWPGYLRVPLPLTVLAFGPCYPRAILLHGW